MLVGWPSALTEDGEAKPDRGFFSWCVDNSGLLVAYKWMDKKYVHLLSTAHGTADRVVMRKNALTGQKEPVPAPDGLYAYTGADKRMGVGMGGVDGFDKMRTGPSAVRKSFFPKKFWMALFWALVDLLVCNVFLLWKMMVGGSVCLRAFTLSLAQELLDYADDIEKLYGPNGRQHRDDTRSRLLRKRTAATMPRVFSSGGADGPAYAHEHYPVAVDGGQQRKCPVCKWYLQQRSQGGTAVVNDDGKAAKPTRVRYMCASLACKSVPLCTNPPKGYTEGSITCFALWHDPEWRAQNAGTVEEYCPRRHSGEDLVYVDGKGLHAWVPRCREDRDDDEVRPDM